MLQQMLLLEKGLPGRLFAISGPIQYHVEPGFIG